MSNEFYIPYQRKGILIASAILILWILNVTTLVALGHMIPLLPALALMLIQAHIHTGLFITAHDAMHGTIAPGNKQLNTVIGSICTFFYAFFPYSRLLKKHHAHHDHVHTEEDPDFHGAGFLKWYFNFITEYVSWKQILGYSVIFTILNQFIDTRSLLLFWIFPALISTLQMFYFGTYLPHKGDHLNTYQSASQRSNHLRAFFTCYFFGYHYEHHAMPWVPWWQLWRAKEYTGKKETIREF